MAPNSCRDAMLTWPAWPGPCSAAVSALSRWWRCFAAACRWGVSAGKRSAMRLFVALAIPDAVAQSLMLIQAGVPGARWQSREQLHLTLSFIGEVDGRDAAMI